MAIPSVLKAYSLFVDGRGYAGKADVELPELGIVTEEYAAGGMSGKVKLDMGLVEALDAKFTLYEYSPDVIKMWGLVDGGRVPLVFRGAAMADDGAEATPIKATMRGQMHVLNGGSWEAGSKAKMECTVNCRSYKLEVGGQTVIEIDAERMIRVVGGTDQMAALRGAIGL
ncbi:phage major tail tube protein [Thiocapsa sp. UBA6158]|jgi:P2 family phage contractile tail tube protein|uniref:phage major tail tube protein n=1 Tax=Thiocapsa sp. UBA6158 TaxID=1947692 RepID=UPI0025CBA5D2|nr:phage major tail tube protein [Thiocapsa sp. UBA6158]